MAPRLARRSRRCLSCERPWYDVPAIVLKPTPALQQRLNCLGWRDLGSLNGTYINRDRIDEQELHEGDELQVGKFKLLFVFGTGEI